MKEDIHFSSRLLSLAGGLMTLAGLLMAVCVNLLYGGIFWAAAACMFFAAYHFRLAENKKMKTEETDDEKTAL